MISAEESFDLIVSVATLHHMDAGAALTRMRALLRPGGTLAIVGLARPTRPSDLPYEIGGLIAHQIHRRRNTRWDHPSPNVWPPPVSYREMRLLGTRLLPGASFRRLLMWRYSLLWRKPADGATEKA
jgi:SAM-dependent methyltransferase